MKHKLVCSAIVAGMLLTNGVLAAQITVRASPTQTINQNQLLEAECLPGEQVVSGGYQFTDAKFDVPIFTSMMPVQTASGNQGWRIQLSQHPARVENLTVYAICMAN
ncbi:hypothetical protein MNO14_01790 [Luteimonas sp. S4-F44]|uniref:hypothetical protein n=1 Tax=Luteimonas sp. S4-F44 TaxID=2925842 RepID=UPI001F52F42F|nr:hypothetical protein [Luteimonas sp. S4-F44]UNK42865.1 hypothetical protein MNO14_01790 [Luteimonas sp. S4-F44]